MKARTSDFIDFSGRLFFISTRRSALLENRGTFRAQRDCGLEVIDIEPLGVQRRNFPQLGHFWSCWTFLKIPPRETPFLCAHRWLDFFLAAAESGTTTHYVVLWEYWELSIVPNREISAWLVHAFGPPGKSHSQGCVGGSPGGSWPNWSWCWRLCCPPQRPAGPPGAVGKRGAGEMPKRPPMGSRGDYNSPPRLKFRAWRFGIIG